jgi:hypothetical protein
MDFALAKTWALPRSAALELRWEIFSLLNRASFDLPNRTFGNPDFGRIFSPKNPREMRFASGWGSDPRVHPTGATTTDNTTRIPGAACS